MAMNSAEYLLRFFRVIRSTGGGDDFRFADLSAAMVEVDQVLTTADADGDPMAGTAIANIGALWQAVEDAHNLAAEDDLEIIVPAGKVELSNKCAMALWIARQLIGDKVIEYSQDRRDSVQILVNSLPDALEQLSIPDELKKYVLILTSEVQDALGTYNTTGDFKLDAAFSRLQSALFVVATSSTEPEQHNSFMSFLKDKLLPCITAVSLTLGVPQAAINDINLFTPQIGQSNQQTSAEKHQPDTRPTAPGSATPTAQQ